MRFETSVVLFALGALTGASVLEDSQLAQMTANPILHPEFMATDLRFCKYAVDRIRNTSLNEDPNVAIKKSSKGSPYTDPGFSGRTIFDWQQMPLQDTSESLVDDASTANLWRISKWFHQDTYSMWGNFDAEHTDPVIGGLKDCSLITAAQMVASKPDRIKKLFLTKDLNENGVYTVKLYQMGIPVTVTVDDTLPFELDQGQHKPMYAQVSADGALWMPILEKAVAKLYGNYERLLGSSMRNALQTLTGAPYEEIIPEGTKTEDLQQWIEKQLAQNRILTVMVKGSKYESYNQYGVPDFNEYIIESVFGHWLETQDKVKLIDLRARCEQNIPEPDAIDFYDLKFYYKSVRAYFDFESYTHNYHAFYDVQTPKVKDDAGDYDNLVTEKIKIKTTEKQKVYISVHTNSAQNFKNTDCWSESDSTSKHLWARVTGQNWVDFSLENDAQLSYHDLEQDGEIEVEVQVYWPPEDYSPHDLSVVVWSQHARVTFEPQNNIGQSVKQFPLYSLDQDSRLQSLSGNRLSGREPEDSCTGEECPQDREFGHSDDIFRADMSDSNTFRDNQALLALKSESVSEVETLEDHVSTGVMASVSIAAVGLFACGFMTKGKNVVADDFERV